MDKAKLTAKEVAENEFDLTEFLDDSIVEFDDEVSGNCSIGLLYGFPTDRDLIVACEDGLSELKEYDHKTTLAALKAEAYRQLVNGINNEWGGYAKRATLATLGANQSLAQKALRSLGFRKIGSYRGTSDGEISIYLYKSF